MPKKQVFEGVKVADFSWWGTGPMVNRELAEHGATVVHVECHRRPDQMRLSGPFKDNIPGIDRSGGFNTVFNVNKYSISVDLNTEGGVEVAKRLVTWADIMGENLRPGTMKKWGLDYESVRKWKPDIIYFSTCQQGQSGPWSSFGGAGSASASLAGMTYVTGWPEGDPTHYDAYTDWVSPFYICMAIIGGLLYRRKTGKGIYIDETQYEAGVSLIGPGFLDYAVNGRILERMDNHDPYAAPHGVYRCSGDDRWCAIAVSTDAEWQGFCKVIGQPEWTKDAKFATIRGRKKNEDELDRLTGEWTKDHTAEEVMRIMQEAGVPAGIVATAQDVVENPQLRHRQYFVKLKQTVLGEHLYRSPAYNLSKTPCHMWRGGPGLGEDNEYVFKEILGYSDNEIADLLIKGVITTEADLPATALV